MSHRSNPWSDYEPRHRAFDFFRKMKMRPSAEEPLPQ
jgi:hypothetical protein